METRAEMSGSARLGRRRQGGAPEVPLPEEDGASPVLWRMLGTHDALLAQQGADLRSLKTGLAGLRLDLAGLRTAALDRFAALDAGLRETASGLAALSGQAGRHEAQSSRLYAYVEGQERRERERAAQTARDAALDRRLALILPLLSGVLTLALSGALQRAGRVPGPLLGLVGAMVVVTVVALYAVALLHLRGPVPDGGQGDAVLRGPNDPNAGSEVPGGQVGSSKGA